MDEAKRADVEREVRAAFDAYETALVTNDVEALIDLFAPGPQTVRMMDDSGLYGFDDIAAFRRARDPGDVARTLTRVELQVLSDEIAVATAEYLRTGSGRRGCQSQVWRRLDTGWKVVSAHVSLGA
ncbi:MAG: oxalurate catabolism protein HpxZ [Acuticoccus sp.]